MRDYNRVHTTNDYFARLKRALSAAADGGEIISAVVVASDEMRRAWSREGGGNIDQDPKLWPDAYQWLENLYTTLSNPILATCVAWTKTHVIVTVPQSYRDRAFMPRFISVPRHPGLVNQDDFDFQKSASATEA